MSAETVLRPPCKKARARADAGQENALATPTCAPVRPRHAHPRKLFPSPEEAKRLRGGAEGTERRRMEGLGASGSRVTCGVREGTELGNGQGNEALR